MQSETNPFEPGTLEFKLIKGMKMRFTVDLAKTIKNIQETIPVQLELNYVFNYSADEIRKVADYIRNSEDPLIKLGAYVHYPTSDDYSTN